MNQPRHASFPLPILVAAASLFLYIATLAPGLLWSDSAKLLIAAAEGDWFGYGHGRHPLHALIGHLLARVASPVQLPLPWLINAMSAAAAAIAVGFAAATASRFAGPLPAALAAASLAVAQTFWHYAVITESYALASAFLAAAVWLATSSSFAGRWWCSLLLGGVLGLGVSAHGLLLLTAPGLCLLHYHAGAKTRGLVAAGAGLALGSILVWLPSLIGTRTSSSETLGVVASTIAHARLFLEVSHLPRELLLFPIYGAFQFPGLAGIAAVLGGLRAWRSRRIVFAGLFVAISPVVIFASGYFRQRQFAMLGFAWLLMVPFIAIGLEQLLRTTRTRVLGATAIILTPITLYGCATVYAARNGFPFAVRTLPYRDEARYFLWPPKGDVDGARRYVEAARGLPPGATLIIDFNPAEALRYAAKFEGDLNLEIKPVIDDVVHQGGDLDAAMIDLVERELLAGKRVFLGDTYEPYYRIRALGEHYTLNHRGTFVEITRTPIL